MEEKVSISTQEGYPSPDMDKIAKREKVQTLSFMIKIARKEMEKDKENIDICQKGIEQNQERVEKWKKKILELEREIDEMLK